jgi:dienelactone hydrolase
MMDTMSKIMSTSTAWDWVSKPYHIGAAIGGMAPFMYHNRIPVSQPRVRQFMLALREEADKLKLPVGAAGFCWGGNHTVVLCKGPTDTPLNKKGERPLVDVGFTAHPSFLTYPTDFETIQIPLSVAFGDHDPVNAVKNIDNAKAILEAKTDVDTEIKMYPGAGHGFAVS